MHMNAQKNLALVAVALLLAGCASFGPPDYRPQHAGSIGEGDNSGNISVVLQSDQTAIHRGDELGFSVSIRNVGQQAVLLPRNRDLMLSWVYPDGRRDNFIRDSRDVANAEIVHLEPGEQIVQRSSLKTDYFHRRGITEFRAIVSAAGQENTWTGRATSNGFGVLVE